MNDQETISAAGSLSEVNIHLGYLRRDIQQLGTKIDEQTNHYINNDEFAPIKDAVDKHERAIVALERYQNTLTGKMIGFGLAMGVAFSIISVAVQAVFHI